MKLNHYLIFLLAMLMAGFIQGQDSQEQNVPIVSKAVYFDVTPPLRDMPIVLPGERDRSWKDNIIQNKSMEEEYKNMEADIPEDFVDPVLQQSYPASREITGPVLNFDGVGNVSGVYPPDTEGDGFFVDPSKIQAVYLRGQDDVAAGGMTLWMVGTGYLPGQEDSDTVNVSLAKSAKANAGPDSTICTDETIMLSGSAVYQDSILWKSDGDGTFNDVRILNPIYTPGTDDISKGFVWLRLTAYDSLPCENAHTDKVKITIDECTGISEGTESRFSIKVVPNPAYSQLNFQVSGIENNQETMLTMTNAQGIVVFTMKLPLTDGQYSNSMNISRFPKGAYYLKASNMKEQVTQKVVLQ